jgi:hypothetical protein
VIGKEGGAVGGRQPVDQIAHESKECEFDDRDHCGEDGDDDQPRGHRLGIMPAERHQPTRRHGRHLFRIGLNQAFEEGKQGFKAPRQPKIRGAAVTARLARSTLHERMGLAEQVIGR